MIGTDDESYRSDVRMKLNDEIVDEYTEALDHAHLDKTDAK